MSRLRAQGASRRSGRRVLVVSLLAIGLVLGLAINASGKTSGQCRTGAARARDIRLRRQQQLRRQRLASAGATARGADVEARAVQGQGQHEGGRGGEHRPGPHPVAEQHHPDAARRDHAHPVVRHGDEPVDQARMCRRHHRGHHLGAGYREVRVERQPGLLRWHEGGRALDGPGSRSQGQCVRRPRHSWARHLEGHRERLPRRPQAGRAEHQGRRSSSTVSTHQDPSSPASPTCSWATRTSRA